MTRGKKKETSRIDGPRGHKSTQRRSRPSAIDADENDRAAHEAGSFCSAGRARDAEASVAPDFSPYAKPADAQGELAPSSHPALSSGRNRLQGHSKTSGPEQWAMNAIMVHAYSGGARWRARCRRGRKDQNGRPLSCRKKGPRLTHIDARPAVWKETARTLPRALVPRRKTKWTVCARDRLVPTAATVTRA